MSALTTKSKSGAYVYGAKELCGLLVDRRFRKAEIAEFVKFQSERPAVYAYLKRCNMIPWPLINGYWEAQYKI